MEEHLEVLTVGARLVTLDLIELENCFANDEYISIYEPIADRC